MITNGSRYHVCVHSSPPARWCPRSRHSAPPQQTVVDIGKLTGDAGTPPRLAVPDLLALSTDRETVEAAKTIGEVLWADLNFEREFYMIPRDTYKSIPAAPSIDTVPFDRWRELGADGVVIGTVQKVATGIKIELRLYNVRGRQSIYGGIHRLRREPADLAHTIRTTPDSQRKLRGVARPSCRSCRTAP